MLQRAVCHVTVSRQARCSILPGTVACMASYHWTSHAGLLLFMHCNSRGLIGECSICTELGPRSSSSPKLFRVCVADGASCRSIKSQTQPSSMCMMWRTASLLTSTTMILTAPSAQLVYSASSTSCLAAKSFPEGLVTLCVTMRCRYLQVCIAVVTPGGVHDNVCQCKYWKCLHTELLQAGQYPCFIWR